MFCTFVLFKSQYAISY